MSELPPKPRAEVIRPELTRLPALHAGRRLFRRLLRLLFRLVIFLLARAEIHGRENFPSSGPALVITNHLGDADGILGLAGMPRPIDALAKAELYDFPIVGKVMNAYGVIWVHRGQPDRRAVRAVLAGFEQGRLIGLAPEGRQSLTGALEPGTTGAAYLAMKAGVPLVPLTFTGTQNASVFSQLKRLHRPHMSLTIGPAFYLDDLNDEEQDRHEFLEQATEKIMLVLAGQLPPEYRGVYRDKLEQNQEEKVLVRG